MMRGHLIKYVEAMAGMSYIQDPDYVGGHERWGYAVVAMGIIALSGDWDGVPALLTQTRAHLTGGFSRLSPGLPTTAATTWAGHTRPPTSFGTSTLGAAVAGWVVVFPKPSGEVASLSYTCASGGSAQHLVTGLVPGASVTFSVDGSPRATAVVGPGGCASVTLSASARAVASVE